MNIHFPQHRQWIKSLILSSLMIPTFASAAPGSISNVPLFTVNAAESNIFFLVDNSGSMDLEILTSEADEASNGWDGSLFTDGQDYRYISPDQVDHNEDYRFVPNESDASGYGLWRARNHHYNNIYYNPNIEYEAWIGVDSGGSVYDKYTASDISGSSLLVRQHPYETGSPTFNLLATHASTTKHPDTGLDLSVNLYVPHYYVWDSVNDTNGVVDITDNKVRIDIVSGTGTCSQGTDATEAEQITNTCMLRTYEEEMANFANWWTYHRRREYVAKNGVSRVISSANGIRLGMGNIHNVSSYRYEIASMNGDVSSGNKNGLLNEIFSLQSDQSGTPLKSALNNIGYYYSCLAGESIPVVGGTYSNNIFGNDNCPIDTTTVGLASEPAGVCQQNFTIMVTDGFYADETITDIGGDVNKDIGNDDGDNTTTSATNHLDNTAYTFKFDGNPYADTHTGTLADIAMHYYETDLDTSLDNKVPTICGIDENPMQHMVTYSISMGLSGTLDYDSLPDRPQTGFEKETGGTIRCPAETGTVVSWPDPDDTDSTTTPPGNILYRIDDLMHAAYNGRGTFASASKPEDIVSALEQAFDNAADRTGSAAAVAFNSTTLSANSAVYLALFKTDTWSGDLESYPLDANTGTVGSTRTWSAANKLDTTPYTSRNIITYKDDTSPPIGIPFTWGNLNEDMKDDLRVATAGNDTTAQEKLNYIRGDTSNEGTGLNFRDRESRLGDIVHSAPVFVGRPQQAWPDGDDDGDATTSNGWPDGNNNYSYFRNNTQSDTIPGMKDRSGVVYVGANDGMLHGFSETTGSEVIAYIPNYLFSTDNNEGLHYLADRTYGHRYYVDLTPTIADIYSYTRNNTSTKSWRTVLIGGSAAGGRGLFALDVTDPALLTEGNADDIVLWEFTSDDDPRLGKTFSRPVIAPVYDTDTDDLYRWVAIFGNGYNNTEDGKAHLFVLFIDGGLDGVWTEGTDYFVLTTPAGSLDTTTTTRDCSFGTSDCNGLSSPAVIDLDDDSVADSVYVGDLHGNIWAFDLTDTNPSNWEIKHGNSNDEPLFTATDGSSRQPITTKPQIASHPTEATANTNKPNVLVMFGTGQYLVSGDASTTDLQTFYAVWDDDEGNNAVGSKSRSDLQPQTIQSETTVSGKEIRVISDNDVNWANKDGWYLDLAFDSNSSGGFTSSELLGERLVTTPLLRGDVIFFNTTIPSLSPCDAGGSGWQMSLDYANGGRPDEAVFDVDGDGIVDESDLYDHDSDSNTDSVAPGGERFGHGMPAAPAFLGNKQYTPGTTTTTGDEITQRDVMDLGGYKTGRLSWQQLQ